MIKTKLNLLSRNQITWTVTVVNNKNRTVKGIVKNNLEPSIVEQVLTKTVKELIKTIYSKYKVLLMLLIKGSRPSSEMYMIMHTLVKTIKFLRATIIIIRKICKRRRLMGHRMLTKIAKKAAAFTQEKK